MKEGIKGASAAEATARHIEDLILEGSLRPGEPLLPEREMAVRLSVSRPTLRQGIKLLEDKGLLVAEPGGGRVVAPLATSVTDPLIELMSARVEVVDDYLELRATMERMAASLAATRANDVDRATLRSCMDRIDRAHAKADPHDEADADVDLHVAIYEASHNIVLLQMMRALSGMLRKGVFHNREKLYARPEVREVLLDAASGDLRGRHRPRRRRGRPRRRGAHGLHQARPRRDRRRRSASGDLAAAHRRREHQLAGPVRLVMPSVPHFTKKRAG